jgi:hypothetical protein
LEGIVTSSFAESILADPSLLQADPGTRASDLKRAQAALASPPAGQRAVLVDPLAATVQNPLGEPASVQGMRASEQLGPFVGPDGIFRRIIILPITTSNPFAFGSAASPFGVLPIVNAPPSGTSFTLGAGSVWFETNLLVSSVAAGSFSGFLISGGTLTASALLTLQSGTYVAPPGTTLTMTANLAPPAAGTGSPGADLTGATIALPASVTIVFTQGSATVTALGNSGVTLYGTAVELVRNTAAPQALTGFPAILIPCTASISTFGFAMVASKLFVPSGTAAINGAGWSLPIATTILANLGAASSAGSLVLELGAGASLVSAIRTGKAAIGGWLIGIDPTQLTVIAGGTGPANIIGYRLWPARPPAHLPSSIEWANPAGFIASLRATPGNELLSLTGLAGGFLDRPLAVDGGALPMAGAGTLFLTLTATATTLAILAQPPTPLTETFSIALENALIGVHAPRLFLVTGPLASPAATQLTSAAVTILLDALWLVPTLPDPYAASFDPGPLVNRAAIGLLGVGLSWPGGAKAVGVTFAIGPLPAGSTPPVIAGAPTSPILPPQVLTLLDLSTNVDLFGVQIESDSAAGTLASAPRDTSFLGLSLAVSDAAIAVFALPQLSWEPMVNEATSPPTTLAAVPATDGVPTLVQAPSIQPASTQTLVPVAPEPVLLRTIGNVGAGASFQAQFSLPFGMIANINQPNRPPVNQNPSLFALEGGRFGLVRPKFTAGTGALQLLLGAPNPTQPNAKFAGSTTLSTDGPAPGYGTNVLGSDVATIFQGEFSSGGGVPVLRADLAGYGASIWSEWLDPNVKGTAIIKVQFETVVGRTAYEVVKAQTTLYPHGVRLVRTVTIARQNAGWVQRTDSGWVAATPGIYNFPNAAFPQTLVNRGAVAGVFNVRNVREFETVTAGGFTYRRALFDADVGIDHRVKVTAGGHASSLVDAFGQPVTLVPARNLTGYVQIAPDESGSPPPPNPDPAPADLALLFSQVGPIADSLSCVAEIGGTGTAAGVALRCSGMSFDMTATPSVTLGAALLSSPVLPRDGAWGLGKRASTGTAPVALPQGAPVPLVQPQSDPSTWHFADIADVLQLATPANLYGLLQDTGTQRTLFEQPTVKDLTGAPPGSLPAIQLPSGVAPALADLGSILGATGMFPDIAKTISFLTGAIEQLKSIPQGLFYTKELDFTGNEDPTTLLDLGVLQIQLIYADTGGGQTGSTWNKPTKISFNIDPAHTLSDSQGRNWWLSIAPLSFTVTIPEFGKSPLLTIVGGFGADDHSKPGLTGLTIDYGAALDTLKSIFSKLQALASFLPGGLGAGLDVSLSNGQLTVRDTFALPTLPLGLGELSDISLDLGLRLTLSPLSADFIIGIGDPGNPFNWIVSPLAGNGAIDVGVKGGAPDFLIQAGIGLGLSIDIGIAEGSASITLAFSLEVNGSTITVMIILNGQASVDVLGGLASASLSLTAAIGVSINPLPVPIPTTNPLGIEFPSEDITFLASVSVGIHISICWVISIDFSGSWQFSQSVHTPQLTVNL